LFVNHRLIPPHIINIGAAHYSQKAIENKQNSTQETRLHTLTPKKAEICQKKSRKGQDFLKKEGNNESHPLKI
jgi:hypothetical protein